MQEGIGRGAREYQRLHMEHRVGIYSPGVSVVELEGLDGGEGPSQLKGSRDVRHIGWITASVYGQSFETPKQAGCDMSDKDARVDPRTLVEGQGVESGCTCPTNRLGKEVPQG